MGEIIKFQNAGLPKINVGTFRDRLQTARDQVSVGSGTPFLKLSKEDGVWVYGKEDMEIEEGSLWAINPLSMQTGVIAWPPASSKLKEPIKKMRAIFDDSSPVIDRVRLGEPANGGVWDDCICFQLQCIGGKDPKVKIEDVGTVVEYQQNSYGGKKAFDALALELMKQIEENPTQIVPVVELLSTSYKHEKWGDVYNPVFEVVKWVGMDGAEALAPSRQIEEKAAASDPRNDAPRDPPPAEEPPVGRRGRRGTAAVEPEQPANNGAVQRRRRR